MFIRRKIYNELLEQRSDFERIAVKAVAQNGRLLDEWNRVLEEMKEIQKLNHRLEERNEELVARCKELEEKFNFMKKQRDYYYELLEDTSEVLEED